MAGQSTSTLSALLRENVQGTPLDLLFRRADFLNLLRAMPNGVVDSNGPAPFSWVVVNDDNSSVEVFVEGQAPPAPGYQATTRASLSPFYVRGTFARTGHVRDNEMKSGFYTPDGGILQLESALAQADVFFLLEQQLLGSTQDRGVASIIDSSGTYANISASTVTSWASEENGTIGTLGVDDLEDLYEELISAAGGGSVPRGVRPTHVLMPPNQITNYTRTNSFSATTVNARIPMGSSPIDLGMNSGMNLLFNGLPVVAIPMMTTTETYMMDLTDVQLIVHRDLRLDPISGNPESESYQVSYAVALKVGHRNHHGKMTGITA